MDIHSSGRINAGHFFIPLLAIGIFLLLTLPVWRWLWQEWMGNTYYSHGLLIPPLSLFLALQRMRRDSSFAWIPGQNSFAGMTVLAVSLTVFLYALNNKAFYIASFAMIGLIVGLVWTTGGIIAISKLIFPILYRGGSKLGLHF
ncbi:exosortase/archaeosortase family protein [Chloroflexi bacterium TSY]|nr:exosortase/archaeosortase family protein [Chloroflexi bacterium TSY]